MTRTQKLKITGERTPSEYVRKIHEEVGMFGLGTPELVVILVIVMVLFGASRLPQLGRGVGEAIRNFKKGISETEKWKDSNKSPREDG